MGGSTTTEVKPNPPSQQELDYYASQQALAAKQLELLGQQQDVNQSYLTNIKPLLDAQTKALQTQLDQANSPEAQQYNKDTLDLQRQQLALMKSYVDQANDPATQQQNRDLATKAASLQQQQMDLLKSYYDAANDPAAKQQQADIAQKAADLQSQQLDVQKQLLAQQSDPNGPQAKAAQLQTQLLQKQLDAMNGPTPEQLQAINDATNSAYASGSSDIQDATKTALDQLTTQLAPSLGLRPSDTPIIDRGQLVAKEAVRQAGNLASDLQGANANARLNYPLAVNQVNNAQSQFQQNIGNAQGDFAAQLADAAATNRARLLANGAGTISSGIGLAYNPLQLTSTPGSVQYGGATNSALFGNSQNFTSGGLQQGIGLVGSARENPLTFQSTGGTTTANTNPGFLDYVNGFGNLFQGLGSMGVGKSDARTKYNVVTDHYDEKGRRWVNFTYKGEPPNVRHHGVIAQEVERTDPEAVLTNGIGLKFVDYSQLRRRAA